MCRLHFRPKTPPPQEPEPMLVDQAPSQICVTYPAAAFALQQQTTAASCIPSQLLSDVTMEPTTSSGSGTIDLLQTSLQQNKQLNVSQQEGQTQPPQETQDSQLVEVDVVGADGGPTELASSFGSLPTSQFVLGTSSDISSNKVPSGMDQPPSLVQPTVVAVNHTGTKNVVSNHSLIDVTKGKRCKGYFVVLRGNITPRPYF